MEPYLLILLAVTALSCVALGVAAGRLLAAAVRTETGARLHAEAALLAGLPQSPSRLRPDRFPQRARARRRRVLTAMAALGMIYSVGLWLVGVQLALLLGVIAGLASLVPYLGFIVGITASFIAAWAQFGDWTMLLWVALVFGSTIGLSRLMGGEVDSGGMTGLLSSPIDRGARGKTENRPRRQ